MAPRGVPPATGGTPPRPPFGWLRLAALPAAGYAVAALVWVAFGDTLPGGRWFAVHLFTLGILSNLVVALSEHFAETVLHAASSGNRTRRLVALNVGALLLLAFPPSLRYPFAAGATILAATVVWLLADLRRSRRRSLGSRFAFVVRGYEHACVAFLVGAALGAALGLGLLPGRWYGAGRLAHLHVNVLGWGGLTLLATVVFFGPTMLRARLVDGAERRASRALAIGAGGLALGVVGLLATGNPAWGAWPRAAAATGLGAYALGGVVVCRDVLRAARTARPSTAARMIVGACAWFGVVAAVDVAAVASGRWRLLDAAGAVLLVAVLGQAILASLNHLNPLMWASGAEERAAVTARMQTAGGLCVAALNAGAMAVLAAGLAGPGAGGAGAVVARVGWALIAVAVLAQVFLLAADPIRRRRSPITP